jgi:hypothetical protein
MASSIGIALILYSRRASPAVNAHEDTVTIHMIAICIYVSVIDTYLRS